mmetsp:Transcript_56543/g.151164  ORF Transcript_56543/g.151164 Transcript_56543/m.151164 type:complete len:103 (-) Transcript_56543:2-310(-)
MAEAVRVQLRALCTCRARRVVEQDTPDVELLGEEGRETRCVRCDGRDRARFFCDVAIRSIYDRDPPCPHGPFCSRCRRCLELMTLSTCVCRGLITAWPDKPS